MINSICIICTVSDIKTRKQKLQEKPIKKLFNPFAIYKVFSSAPVDKAHIIKQENSTYNQTFNVQITVVQNIVHSTALSEKYSFNIYLLLTHLIK